MKKIIILIILFFSTFVNAQEISYGVVLANSFYEVGNNNGTDSFEALNNNSLHIGVYGEYNFTEKIGIKTEINFNNKEVSYRAHGGGFSSYYEFELKYIEIASNFKYDFGQEYRKGFYMLAGPKFSMLTSAKSEGEDAKEAFESFNLGAQLGFGWRILKFTDLQAKIEYDITPFFKTENDHRSVFFGGVVSLNIDLERIINN